MLCGNCITVNLGLYPRFESKARWGSWKATVEEMKTVIKAVNESERRIMARVSSFDDKQTVCSW